MGREFLLPLRSSRQLFKRCRFGASYYAQKKVLRVYDTSFSDIFIFDFLLTFSKKHGFSGESKIKSTAGCNDYVILNRQKPK